MPQLRDGRRKSATATTAATATTTMPTAALRTRRPGLPRRSTTGGAVQLQSAQHGHHAQHGHRLPAAAAPAVGGHRKTASSTALLGLNHHHNNHNIHNVHHSPTPHSFHYARQHRVRHARRPSATAAAAPSASTRHTPAPRPKRRPKSDSLRPQLDDDDDDDDMATSFLNYCATCEKLITTPNNSLLYCSQRCRLRDSNKPSAATEAASDMAERSLSMPHAHLAGYPRRMRLDYAAHARSNSTPCIASAFDAALDAPAGPVAIGGDRIAGYSHGHGYGPVHSSYGSLPPPTPDLFGRPGGSVLRGSPPVERTTIIPPMRPTVRPPSPKKPLAADLEAEAHQEDADHGRYDAYGVYDYDYDHDYDCGSHDRLSLPPSPEPKSHHFVGSLPNLDLEPDPSPLTIRPAATAAAVAAAHPAKAPVHHFSKPDIDPTEWKPKIPRGAAAAAGGAAATKHAAPAASVDGAEPETAFIGVNEENKSDLLAQMRCPPSANANGVVDGALPNQPTKPKAAIGEKSPVVVHDISTTDQPTEAVKTPTGSVNNYSSSSKSHAAGLGTASRSHSTAPALLAPPPRLDSPGMVGTGARVYTSPGPSALAVPVPGDSSSPPTARPSPVFAAPQFLTEAGRQLSKRKESKTGRLPRKTVALSFLARFRPMNGGAESETGEVTLAVPSLAPGSNSERPAEKGGRLPAELPSDMAASIPVPQPKSLPSLAHSPTTSESASSLASLDSPVGSGGYAAGPRDRAGDGDKAGRSGGKAGPPPSVLGIGSASGFFGPPVSPAGVPGFPGLPAVPALPMTGVAGLSGLFGLAGLSSKQSRVRVADLGVTTQNGADSGLPERVGGVGVRLGVGVEGPGAGTGVES